MILSLFAATAITLLNGEGWTCDGVPVRIPHTWNAADYDRGFVPDCGPTEPFGFDVRIREDDGDGEDGYLRLVNDSEDPVRVRFK